MTPAGKPLSAARVAATLAWNPDRDQLVLVELVVHISSPPTGRRRGARRYRTRVAAVEPRACGNGTRLGARGTTRVGPWPHRAGGSANLDYGSDAPATNGERHPRRRTL